MNYIIWLQDLLDSTGPTNDEAVSKREVVGLDMYAATTSTEKWVLTSGSGTGCCSIYPLLGCRVRPSWTFLATGMYTAQSNGADTNSIADIDQNNVRTAQQNVKLNRLESRIRVMKTEPQDLLIPLEKFGQQR